jgi:hypothetical protein
VGDGVGLTVAVFVFVGPIVQLAVQLASRHNARPSSKSRVFMKPERATCVPVGKVVFWKGSMND